MHEVGSDVKRFAKGDRVIAGFSVNEFVFPEVGLNEVER